MIGSLATHLAALGASRERLVDELAVPLVLTDPSGAIRWQNHSALELFGDVRGRHYSGIVAQDHRLAAQEWFTRLLFCGDSHEGPLIALDADGERIRIELRTTPVHDADGRIVALFSVVAAVHPDAVDDPLTARQRQVLDHLAAGQSTAEVAKALGISVETTRNHIRDLMRNLCVHSRLEAVARGRELGLL